MHAPAPALAVLAMLSVQLGVALSTELFEVVSPAGIAWLRLCFASIVLLAVIRPRPAAVPAEARPTVLLLGVASAVMTLAFLEAIALIPLGIAVAIEFLGPLAVAALRSRRRWARLWLAVGLVGVLGLVRPWTGIVDLDGVAFAGLAAAGWAAYLVLIQRMGDKLDGLDAPALSISAAALFALPFGAPSALAAATPTIALQSLGLAVLLPLLPYVLEMQAVRGMRLSSFNALMAVEPGIAMLVGAVVLTQIPAPLQLAGTALVILAGLGAERR